MNLSSPCCVRKPDVCKNVLAQVFTSTRWYELLIIAINMLRSTMSEAAWYSVNRIAVHICIKLWSLNTARLSNVIMSKLAHISVTMVSIRLKIKVLKIFVSPQIQILKEDLEAFSSCFDKVKLWPNSFGVIREVIRESVVVNPSPTFYPENLTDRCCSCYCCICWSRFPWIDMNFLFFPF